MKKIIFYLVWLCCLFSCRKAPVPLPSEISKVEADPHSSIKGFYLVNEGNMNMNKASLDYLDLINGIYKRNIYNEINPNSTKGLGDVGNDIGIYGAKMYIVVNISNKVEVLEVKTGKRIGQVDLLNGRYIQFHQGKAYVSAYLGKVGDPAAPRGIVAEIDTGTLQVTRRVEVGRQPEEMAIVKNRLYVANSGGYSPPNYESTVSVIDLEQFKEIKRIEVAVNLHRLKADRYGDLYVTSRGDYYGIPSRLFVIDTSTDRVKKVFEIAAGNLAIDDDLAYIYSTSWNYLTGKNTISYHLIDIKNELLLERKFINDGSDKKIQIPYGISVNRFTKEVYLTDARDYVSPGVLHCYRPDGTLKWSVKTGDIPAHIAFVY